MDLLAGIIILGIFAQWLAWRIKVPAILPLIIIGLLVGPLSSLVREDGTKWLEPIFDQALQRGLFPGESLFYFVSLAIGVILFEGGLTLKRRELAEVGPLVLQLITLGSLVTFIGAGLGAHYIIGLSWPISFLFGALIIVTGPTVIAPILQNVPLTRNVATVLKWEGILIDPIGALVAVLVFEFVQTSDGGVAFTSHALITFSQIILIGLALGTLAALGLYQLIKRELIPHYLLNVFTLAAVLGVFVFSDFIAHESGLLSVVVMGMVMGNLDFPRLNDILYFKESLSVLLISILFILLAANIELDELNLIFKDWRGMGLLAFVAFFLRPVSIFLSTRKSELETNEKLFISWVGPRGIVAAGIASLFGIKLTQLGVEGAEYITPLVFMIVLGTVLLNATTARLVARLLNVIQEASDGILIIGAARASRVIGKYLHENGRHVVLVDSNEANIKKAKGLGLEAFNSNIYNDDLNEHMELVDMGYLIAMTASPQVNEYAVKHYEHVFGENGTFRLITPEELMEDTTTPPDNGLFSYRDDFLNLNEVARDYPFIHEIEVPSPAFLKTLLAKLHWEEHAIPIFMKDQTGQLQILTSKPEEMSIVDGTALVYMGKKLELGSDSLQKVEEVE
ncbi:MAG: sodium:proton antiporter [Saprospiraceae bacterium]|nr:sodium:proton antiporter [Saprospiraceae bacterium]